MLAFEPDLVLLQYHVNDVFAHALDLEPPRRRGALERLTDPRRDGLARELEALGRARHALKLAGGFGGIQQAMVFERGERSG